MPFRSEAQRRYLWANDPKLAKKWADKYGTPKGLPYHAKDRPMARLSAAQRKALPPSSFAVPSKAPGPGSYPITDQSHAQNAKARASQFAKPSTRRRVDAKANKLLHHVHKRRHQKGMR
jgi:hypothetical protein